MPRLILPLAVLLILVGAPPARAGAFEDGLTLFRHAAKTREEKGEAAARGRFREAARVWEKLAASGKVSSRLYTNIGNARALAGDAGEAVLAYRRALAVDPGNDRARRALASIRAKLGVPEGGKSAESGLVRALFFWHWALAPGTRRTLFAIAWVAGFGLLVLSLRKRRARLPGIVLVILGGVLLVSLGISDASASDVDQAVLMVRTEGRTGDGTFYSPSHSGPLPAGLTVTVRERRGKEHGWIHGELADGTTTWLPADSVRDVIPR